jgi:hypothetical protein
MSRGAHDDIAVYEHHDLEVRCRCPVGLVPLNDEGHKGPGIWVEVAPHRDGLRRTAVAEILGVAKNRWADSRHLDRIPRGLIAKGVTIARRSEEDDALLFDRLHRLGDDTRLVERFMEIDDVVADDATPCVGEGEDPIGEILLGGIGGVEVEIGAGRDVMLPMAASLMRPGSGPARF